MIGGRCKFPHLTSFPEGPQRQCGRRAFSMPTATWIWSPATACCGAMATARWGISPSMATRLPWGAARKGAESICRHVEALLSAKIGGQPVARDTAAWLATIGGKLRNKLAAVGVVEAPKRAALGEFLRSYILARPDVKSATLEVWQQPCRNLTEFFGDDKPLRTITIGDGDQFKAWLLTQDLAPATTAKRLAFARAFLHVARKHRLIDENPLSEIKIPAANVSG